MTLLQNFLSGAADNVSHFKQTFSLKENKALSHLIYDGFECDLQVVHSCQLHGLINAFGSQRVSPENGVGIPTERQVC